MGDTPKVLCANKYGKFYLTSEGYHINGNKPKFISLLKKDLNNGDAIAEMNARYILDLIDMLDEI